MARASKSAVDIRSLAKDTELAFALLEHGVRHLKGQ